MASIGPISPVPPMSDRKLAKLQKKWRKKGLPV